MKCRKCGSDNISIQQVAVTKTKGKGLMYWVFWVWFDLILWVLMFLPRLIIGLFKRNKVKTTIKKIATCQNCGNSWRIRF